MSLNSLIVGDLHIRISNIPESDEMIKKLVELASQKKPDFIVLLGDILDRHATINVHCLMRAQTLIYSLSLISPTYVLIGNHDRPNNSNFLTDEHAFNSLKHWPNTYIIDAPLDKTFELNDHKYRFLFLPYVMTGRFDEALQKLENPYDKNISAIFAHQEMHLCKMGAIISQNGDKWDPEYPLLISGHIHSRDLLQPNMLYIGVPIQIGFDDEFKTVSLFTFNQDNKWSEERIDLGLMKKVTVYIRPEDLYNYEPPSDKLIKLVIKGGEAEIKTITKIDKISQLKKKGVIVVFKTVQENIASDNSHIPKQRVTYRERLTSNMDSELMKWFIKIF